MGKKGKSIGKETTSRQRGKLQTHVERGKDARDPDWDYSSLEGLYRASVQYASAVVEAYRTMGAMQRVVFKATLQKIGIEPRVKPTEPLAQGLKLSGLLGVEPDDALFLAYQILTE